MYLSFSNGTLTEICSFKPSENSILFQEAHLKSAKIIGTQDSKDIQPDS